MNHTRNYQVGIPDYSYTRLIVLWTQPQISKYFTRATQGSLGYEPHPKLSSTSLKLLKAHRAINHTPNYQLYHSSYSRLFGVHITKYTTQSTQGSLGHEPDHKLPGRPTWLKLLTVPWAMNHTPNYKVPTQATQGSLGYEPHPKLPGTSL